MPKALELGLVNETGCDLAPTYSRAWALAEQFAQQPSLLLRYTRVLFTQPLKRQVVEAQRMTALFGVAT